MDILATISEASAVGTECCSQSDIYCSVYVSDKEMQGCCFSWYNACSCDSPFSW